MMVRFRWGVLLAACLLASAFPVRSAGPPPFEPVWFYDREMRRQMPEIDPDWLAAGLASDPTAGPEAAVRSLRGEIPGVSEIRYDPNLAEDAAFLRLGGGEAAPDETSPAGSSATARIVQTLTERPTVRFVHPVFRMDGDPVAALDLFRMEWKHGVSPDVRQRLTDAAGAERISGDLWRITVARRPFFKAVNLLAEDLHVRYATPELVPIRPTIQGRLDLDFPGGAIGDSIPFQLTIRFSDGIDLDPAALARLELRPSAIPEALFQLRMASVDHVAAVAHSPVELQGKLRFLAPGDYQLPDLSLPYTCRSCPDQPVRRLRIPGPTVRIASIVPPETDARLLLPTEPPVASLNPEPARRDARFHFRWAMGGFLIGLLALGSVWRIRRGSGKPAPAPSASPERAADRELRALLKTGSDGPDWRYLRDVGGALRRFLRDRYAPEGFADGGGGSRFFQSIADRISVEHRNEIARMLDQVDRAVAREVETVPDLDSFQRSVRALLDAISPPAAAADPESASVSDDQRPADG